MKGYRAKWIGTPTKSGDFLLVADGGLKVDNNKIVEVGKVVEMCFDDCVETVNLPNHLLIPGLINCHSHCAMSLLRGFADDLSLENWLNNFIWPAETKYLSSDYVRVGSELGIHEMLQTGTTAFVDSYYFSCETAKVAEKAGIRYGGGDVILDFKDGKFGDCIKNSVNAYNQLKNMNSELVFPIFTVHSCYTVDEQGLIASGQQARKLGGPVQIHMQETQAECEIVTKTMGRSPVEVLSDPAIDLLNNRLIAAHCVWLTEQEKQKLAEKGVHVVHCPKSNMKLASGSCPVQDLLDRGVNVALGTDGPCSNNGMSMVSEMTFACMLGKLSTLNPEAVSCRTALKMATINGAKALGMDHLIGSLEVGKLADFVAFDMSDVSCLPLFDPISALIYSNGVKLAHSWINGQQVVRDGVVLRMTPNVDEVLAIGDALTRFRAHRETHSLNTAVKVAKEVDGAEPISPDSVAATALDNK